MAITNSPIKPGGPPYILNGASPQAQGLIYWAPLGMAGAVQDLVQGHTSQALVGTVPILTPYGLAMNCGTANNLGFRTAAPASLQGLQAVSLMVVFWQQATPVANAPLFGVSYTSTDSGGFQQYVIMASTTTAMKAAWNNAGALVSGTTATYPANGAFHIAAATIITGSQILYVDGVQVASDALAISSINSSNGNIEIGQQTSDVTTRTSGAYILDCRIYNRILTATEVRAFTDNWTDLYYVPAPPRVKGQAAATTFPPGNFTFPKRFDLPEREVRGFQAGIELNLLGQDTFFNGPGRGPVYDYPNPLPHLYPAEARNFIDPSEIWLQGQDQFFGAPGERNLTDFPNPRGYPFPVDNRTYVDPSEVWLKDTFFGVAGNPTHDWPVPPGYPYPTSLRTYLDLLKVNLQGQDTFFEGAGRGPSYDYPNPLRAGRLYLADPLNLLGTTLAPMVFVQPPFYLSDYPNPAGYPFPITLRTYVDLLKVNLQGQDTFFGAPGQPPTYTYPNPERVRARDFSWLNSLLSSTLQPLPVGSEMEWVNPKGQRFTTQEVFQSVLALTTVVAAGVPFSSLSWPNPASSSSPRSNLSSISPRNPALFPPTPTPPSAALKVIMVNGRLAFLVHGMIYDWLE